MNTNAEYIAKHENRMKPSSWLRLRMLQMHLADCERFGASADMYCLPTLPQDLLDRLDRIEPEHLGPIAADCNEMTTDDTHTRLEHYTDAPHQLYVELQKYEFRREGEWRNAGAGFMALWVCPDKPNVLYVTETDGESGVWCGYRFGHFID